MNYIPVPWPCDYSSKFYLCLYCLTQYWKQSLLPHLWPESKLLNLVHLPECNSTNNREEIESFSLKPFFYGQQGLVGGLEEKLSTLTLPLHKKKKLKIFYYLCSSK
jgi:hypothetical protein